MIVMFYVFVIMKAIETTNMYRYPAATNCDSIKSMFYTEKNGVATFEQGLYEYYADYD